MACGGGCAKRRAMLRKSADQVKSGNVGQGLSGFVEVAKHLVRNPPTKPTVRRVIIK